MGKDDEICSVGDQPRVYAVNATGEVGKEYCFSFGDHGIDTTIMQNRDFMSRLDHKNLIGYEKIEDLYTLGITANYLGFMAPIIGDPPVAGIRYVHKKSGNNFFIPFDEKHPSRRWRGFPIPGFTNTYGPYFIRAVPAIDIIETLESLSETEKKALQSLEGFSELGQVEVYDNPVLVMYEVSTSKKTEDRRPMPEDLNQNQDLKVKT